jgi:hypothetical protein
MIAKGSRVWRGDLWKYMPPLPMLYLHFSAEARRELVMCGSATEQLWLLGLLRFQQLLYEERGRGWGPKLLPTLSIAYPTPVFLHDAIRERAKSANLLSTSHISLQTAGFLLALSWFLGPFISLCTHPCCHLCAWPSQAVQCILWKPKLTSSRWGMGALDMDLVYYVSNLLWRSA